MKIRKMKSVIILLSIIATPFNILSQDLNKQSNFDILDSNKDGIINPYEALDALLVLEKEQGEHISINNINKIIRKIKQDEANEINTIFEDIDQNKNDVIEFKEVDNEDFLYFLQMMDTDNSKSITKEEMMNFNIEDTFFKSEEEILNKIKSVFNEYATNKIIIIKDLKKKTQRKFQEWDINQDGIITQEEANKYMRSNSMAAKFTIKNNIAYMSGIICSNTPALVLELLYKHPEVRTIEMELVPGSIDDVSNLRASLYIHRFGLTTRLNKNSIIASGGTDLFLAGRKRIIEKGAKIGVHAWDGGDTPATELSKEDEAHQLYIEYYKTVNIPEAFYWYTLKAAPASDIHFMTEKEINKYKIRTNI